MIAAATRYERASDVDHALELLGEPDAKAIAGGQSLIPVMAGLAGRLGGIAGVFFDTSVWSGLDLLDLYRQVAPEQILYASDYPYARQPNSLLVAVRTAKLAGFDDKQLRLMLGGTARRMQAGEVLEPLTGPKGPNSLLQPLTFARIHQYISMAVPMRSTELVRTYRRRLSSKRYRRRQ